jgi:hypothetical protein
MTRKNRLVLTVCFAGAVGCWSSHAVGNNSQQDETTSPLQQKVGPISLRDEYFAAGLAKLNLQTHGLGFAIEFLAGKPGSPPPPDSKFNAEKGVGTVEDTLKWLCALDPRYTWKVDGRIVNIFPRDSVSDPSYLFNRRLPTLRFTDLISAADSLDKIFKPVAKPNESVITIADAGSFPKPWSVTFENISVREALDRVAENLGAGHGWMVSGNADTRLISFYSRLESNAEAEKQKHRN